MGYNVEKQYFQPVRIRIRKNWHSEDIYDSKCHTFPLMSVPRVGEHISIPDYENKTCLSGKIERVNWDFIGKEPEVILLLTD